MSFGSVKKAPTPSDRAQSTAHHMDSVRYNLAHAVTHIQQAASHARRLSGAMRKSPGLATHVRALSRALSPHISKE